MSKKVDFETIRRAFAIFNGFGDSPDNDNLWWRTDGDYAPITLLTNCNDLFFWGCADCEEITPDNIADLERAHLDANQAGEGCGRHAHLLFVARLRGERPQGACYKHFDERLWPLFDACGPERETGLGNPTAHPNA